MAHVAAGKIANRLEEAAEAIERSLRRTRRSVGSAAADMSEHSGSAIESEWIALKKDLSDLMNRSELADRVDNYAHASPWQAAGIAAAAGFVIGVLLSRK